MSLFKKVFRRKFAVDLYNEINDDNIFDGAAALAYYFLFALFPGMIFLISLIPYLPIDNLYSTVMSTLQQALPGDAWKMFDGIIAEVTQQKRGGLLSIGALLTLWAASSGVYAAMQQLNVTYDVKERCPYWKARGLAILLTVMFAIFIIGSFALIVFGGLLQDWMATNMAWSTPLLFLFGVFRWLVIATLLLGGFAFMYYFCPDVEQDFRFISPGAVIGAGVFVLATLGFRFYVENFSDYAASYGSLGAVIVLMLWLYIAGLVILLGSEINALVEHESDDGKNKGEREATGAPNKGLPVSPRNMSDAEAVKLSQGSAPAQLDQHLKPKGRFDLLVAMGALLLVVVRKSSEKS